MSIHRQRLFAVVTWTPLAILLWSVSLWVFGGGRYLPLYLSSSLLGETLALVLLWRCRNVLLCYFVIGILAYLPSMTLGLSLIAGTLLTKVFGGYLPANLVIWGTLLFFALYCFFPLKYYHDDYLSTRKDRLRSFDFESGTYDISNQSLMRQDAFADYYAKSWLSKAYSGIVRAHLLFPVAGGAVAIVAGKISGSLQLGIGLGAVIISTLTMIQFGMPNLFNAWQVYKLEKQHGKRIRIIWGDDEE